jgi:class 3 adenylate cyclase
VSLVQPAALSLLGIVSFHRNVYRIWQPLAAIMMCWIVFDWCVPTVESLTAAAAGGTTTPAALSLGARKMAGICWWVAWTFFLAKLRLWWAVVSVLTMIAGVAAIFCKLDPWLFASMAAQGAFANFCLFIIGCLAGADFFEQAQRSRFLRGQLLAKEHERSEELLLNILPGPIAQRLKEKTGTIADSFLEVTVMFADIVGFTPLAARSTPEAAVAMLNRIFSRFDQLSAVRGLEKIKTIGDAYMVVGGIPHDLEDHSGAVMALALEMQAEMRGFSEEFGESLRLRIGISSGPIVAGVIGSKKFIYDLWGDTVNMASRMESQGIPGGIQVTQRTYELLTKRWHFAPLEIDIKGRGMMRAYRYEGS